MGPRSVEEDRHVEVRPPLPRRLVRVPAGERVFEVHVVLEVIPAALDRLREIDRLGEVLQRFDFLVGDFADIHRRGFLELDDRDAGVDQLLQRRPGCLRSRRPGGRCRTSRRDGGEAPRSPCPSGCCASLAQARGRLCRCRGAAGSRRSSRRSSPDGSAAPARGPA